MFKHACLLAVLASCALAGAADAQSPQACIFSLSRSVEVLSGNHPAIDPVDAVRFEPGLSAEVFPFLTRQQLDVLTGDANGDGEFNDAPGNVDAMAWKTVTGRPGAHNVVFSFAAASTRFLGGTVLDGDLITLNPGGGFNVAVSEGALSSLTGTRTIDIDAAAYADSGELIFSFTDDELSTHPVLIQQNGNDPKIPDEAILGWMPGTTTVRIVHTKADVLNMVSQTLGKTVTTVVDVVGLAADPVNQGRLWFTTSSSASGIVGAVFTTAGGGAYATMNNWTLDGKGNWGLKSATPIDAMITTVADKDPMCIRLAADRVVPSSNGPVSLDVHGGVTGSAVQVFVSYATFPAPVPFPLGAPLNGVTQGYLTIGDPLFYASPNIPAFRTVIDANGRGKIQFNVGNVPPGVSFVLQAVDLSSYEVSQPVVVDLVTS